MNIRVAIKDMRAAEKFSALCQKFPVPFYLRSGHYCVDPKSTLGILAIMYSARDDITLDTGDMDDEMIADFVETIKGYVVQ